jgi:hypothetical protein
MHKLVKILIFPLASSVLIVSFMYGGNVSGGSQLEIYKALLTVSAIVFAVMGAWLSLLKVEIVQGIKNATSDDEATENVNKARSLIEPMTSSVMIIASCMIYIFLYYSMSELQFIVEHKEIIRQLSFVAVASLTFWQMLSLLKVMFSGVDFLIDISRISKDLSGDRKR